MRSVDLEGLAQCGEERNDRGEPVGDAVRKTGRRTETGQIDRDHVPLGGEQVEDRVPGLQVVAYAVEQQERFARALPAVGDGDGAAPTGSVDHERDLCGHAAAPCPGIHT